ncbi:MAG: hypothetical protein PSV22_04030 [Pseudolabrys sp.]|nr:hypothetical protein [Pseudolabrys sp.]
MVIDETFARYVSSNFEAYRDATSSYGKAFRIADNDFASSYYFAELELGVVTVNTATLTGAGLSDDVDDRAALFIPERSLVEAMETLPNGGRRIVVGHHPVSWLNDENSVLANRLLPELASVYLCGHLHESAPTQTTGFNGNLLVAQSGALYANRKFWNGYAVISLRENCHESRISFRRWFEQRRSFSKAEDLGDDGTFYSSDDAKAHWAAQVVLPSSNVLDTWRTEKLLPATVADCNNSFSEQDIDLVFITPEFDHEVPFGIEADGRVGSRLELLSFSKVLESSENYVVSASSETGKSTMLKQIALSYAKRPVTDEHWKFPVILQFSAIKPYSDYFERTLRNKLPELPDGVTVSSLLRCGTLAILIDDVDFAVKQKREALVKFVSNYPKCRYIFTSSTPFVESSALKPEITPDVPFTRIRMRQIKPEQILTLIESHGTTDPLEADRMLARVLRDSTTLNVPLTPVTGTFLIQIFQNDPDHVMLNQAALTERYVEILLQKYAPRDLLPGTFDFKNKVDLLCTITDFMVRTNDYSPEYNTILTWFVEYLKLYGLKFSASNLLDYFIQARILEHDGAIVRFRLKMFFEFFAATRMIDHADFKDYILHKDRYLSFINEIAFYAALNRKDAALVQLVHDELLRLSEDHWEEGKVPDPESFLKTFAVPGKSTTEAELDEMYGAIKSVEDLSFDRKRLKEGIELVSSEANQVIDRIRYEKPSEQWFAHLIMLSSLVKHMELIPDAQKREYLSGALSGWVQFTANSLGLVNALAKERRVTFNGVTYISTLSPNLPVGEMARRMALSMPAAIGRMAAAFLGTEKLIPQLHQGIGEANEPLGRQLLRISILADLGSTDVARLAAKASARFRGFRFLSHALARKLYEVAVRFRLPSADLAQVRSVAADIYVSLEGVAGGKVAARKARIIEGMATQRRQIDFKNDRPPALETNAAKPVPQPRPKKGRRGRRKR